MPEITKKDLALVSSEDLLTELGERYDDAIFAGVEIGDTRDILYRVKGSFVASIGMAEFIKMKSMKSLMDNK